MKALSVLLLAMALVAAPALADPPGPAAQPAEASPSAPAPPPATSTNGKTTVEGVTVKGKLASGKRCRETDKACLLVVAKEIWDQYPKQIALYCEKERMRNFSDRMNKQAMFGDDPGVNTGISSQLPPALEVVCDYKRLAAPPPN